MKYWWRCHFSSTNNNKGGDSKEALGQPRRPSREEAKWSEERTEVNVDGSWSIVE